MNQTPLTHRFLVLLPLILAGSTAARGAVYHVDFEAGDDARDGLSPATAFRRAPGDPEAGGAAAQVRPVPGDVVRFKGGVVYRGSVTISASGREDAPVVYDGNADGAWGEGRAIIDGSVPLEGLRPCRTAGEAWGNPNFRNIYRTTVPAGAQWRTLNVCESDRILGVAQDPNPGDPVYQEDLEYYHRIATDDVPRNDASLRVRPLGGMGVNPDRPLIAMFDGGGTSAVVERINGGGEVEVALEAPATVAAFAVTPQPGYTSPKELVFVGDGRELLKVTVAPPGARAAAQRFDLPAPATFRTLVIRFVSAHGQGGAAPSTWGAVRAVEAFDAEGRNVLLARQWGELKNDAVFTPSDPDFYRNAFIGVHAQPNFVYYKRILGFDPAAHRVNFEPFDYSRPPYERGGAFAIFNSPRHIDRPGEYAMVVDPAADGGHEVFVWPFGEAGALTRSARGVGIRVAASHVEVRGFWIRKQGGEGSTGLAADGRGARGLTIRGVKVSNVRDAGIHVNRYAQVLVADCEVVDNPGHAKGILVRNSQNVVVSGCTLRRNSSTALDYYTVKNGVVQDCLVEDNRGMHANGLTFYVGCENILVERNTVRDGNVGLTLQDGRNMIIRNNVIEGGRGGAFAVGLWAGKPFDNIVIAHNVLRHHADGERDAGAALYGGNPASKNYAVVNNVIDGVVGNIVFKADLHHNLFTTTGPGLVRAQLGDNRIVENPADFFVDPEGGDWRPKPNSPAVGAGVRMAALNRYDRAGVDRFADGAVDIGPYEQFAPRPEGAPAMTERPEGAPAATNPATFQFSFDGYEIVPPKPVEVVYELRFPRRAGEEILRRGVDRTGEDGGKVNLRAAQGGYISGWGSPGHWLEWTVDVEAAGAYEVAIVHGSEGVGVRQVLLNGEPVPGLEAVQFPPTGAWTTWQERGLEKPLRLKAGRNVVRFVNVSGHHNFKSLRFIPVAAAGNE